MERKTLKETLKRSFSETLYLSSPGTNVHRSRRARAPWWLQADIASSPTREGDSEKWAGFPPSEAPPNQAGPQSSHSSSKPGGAQGAQQPPLREFSLSSRPAADRSCRCDSPAWGWPGDGGASVPRCRTAVKRNHRDAHARADTEPAPRDRPHPPAHAGTSGCGPFQKLQGQDTSERGSSAAGRGGAPGSFPGR